MLIVGDTDWAIEGLALMATGGEVDKEYGDVLGRLTEDSVASAG